MTRAELIVWNQQRAEEYYAFAHWAAGKAGKQRAAFDMGAANLYHVRRNQCRMDAESAAAHAKTTRLLMGMED